MPKIKVSPRQRANALEALNVMWPSVPERNVSSHLNEWRDDGAEPMKTTQPTCHTIACFGGWSEAWPPFRAQMTTDVHDWFNWNKTVRLYGPSECTNIDELFSPRGRHVADTHSRFVSDHQIVTERLRWLLANTEVDKSLAKK